MFSHNGGAIPQSDAVFDVFSTRAEFLQFSVKFVFVCSLTGLGFLLFFAIRNEISVLSQLWTFPKEIQHASYSTCVLYISNGLILVWRAKYLQPYRTEKHFENQGIKEQAWMIISSLSAHIYLLNNILGSAVWKWCTFSVPDSLNPLHSKLHPESMILSTLGLVWQKIQEALSSDQGRLYSF